MLDRLNPLVYFFAVLPFSVLMLVVGYRFAARYGKSTNDKEGWAWAIDIISPGFYTQQAKR